MRREVEVQWAVQTHKLWAETTPPHTWLGRAAHLARGPPSAREYLQLRPAGGRGHSSCVPGPGADSARASRGAGDCHCRHRRLPRRSPSLMLNAAVSHSSVEDSSRILLGDSGTATVPASSRSGETGPGDRCSHHLPASAFKLWPPSPPRNHRVPEPRNHRVLSGESNLRTIESWGRSGSADVLDFQPFTSFVV